MLRITEQNRPEAITLKLEGDLSGVWVNELLDAWRAAHRGARTLRIDLTELTYTDCAGRYLLALIHCHGAQLVGSGLATGELIRTIAHDWPLANTDSKEA